jgi:tRNA (guanine-N(7)-)-methyltransferase subunit TRM82
MMVLPYHLVKVCGNVVFAAQGSDIHSFTSSLEYVSTWKYPAQQREESNGPSTEAQDSPAPEGPPAKRRRVEPGQGAATNGHRADSAQGQPKGKKAALYDVPANERPFVQGLYATTDGRHLVAITGSDKTIWVFEHDGAGNLKQLSQRQVYP